MLNEFNSFNIQKEIWEKLESVNGISPLRRVNHAMYTSGNSVFIHGGQGPNGILNDLWIYDVRVKSWKEIDPQGDVPLPFYRPGFTQFTLNGVVYFALTCFGTEDLDAVNDLYLYNPATKTWK